MAETGQALVVTKRSKPVARVEPLAPPESLAALAEERVRTLPVTRSAAVAGRFRDPADQLIYATAVEHDAVLLSRDGVIRDLDPRRRVW